MQFGFRNYLHTREALIAFHILILACLDFTNYDKAKHDQLMQTLDKYIDSKDRRIIKGLYWDQRATINVEGVFSQEIEGQRGGGEEAEESHG